MTTTDRNDTCEARIGSRLAGRLDDMRLLLAAMDGDEDTPCSDYEPGDDDEPEGECLHCSFDKAAHEGDGERSQLEDTFGTSDPYDAHANYPLSVDTKLLVTVQLSTGGPGDQFECEVDPEDGVITEIQYRFLDWFDGAVRTLRGDEFDVAERFLGQYVEVAVMQQQER